LCNFDDNAWKINLFEAKFYIDPSFEKIHIFLQTLFAKAFYVFIIRIYHAIGGIWALWNRVKYPATV
jgi:hypothetical protein